MTAARAVIFLRIPIEKIRLIFAHRNSIIRYHSFNITPFDVKVNSIVWYYDRIVTVYKTKEAFS